MTGRTERAIHEKGVPEIAAGAQYTADKCPLLRYQPNHGDCTSEIVKKVED